MCYAKLLSADNPLHTSEPPGESECCKLLNVTGENMKIFCWCYGDGVYGKCLWFRIFGYGLHFKKHDARMLFSERYGYARYYAFCGVRIRLLKPSDI